MNHTSTLILTVFHFPHFLQGKIHFPRPLIQKKYTHGKLVESGNPKNKDSNFFEVHTSLWAQVSSSTKRAHDQLSGTTILTTLIVISTTNHSHLTIISFFLFLIPKPFSLPLSHFPLPLS